MNIEKKSKIRAWFIRSGLTQAMVARQLGITPQRFGRVLAGEWPTGKQLAHLRSLGMPEDLLPVSKNS
jgi:transcriptional regulator with XRE-family HTH domain